MEFPGIVIKKFKFEFINYDEIENFNFSTRYRCKIIFEIKFASYNYGI